ncbi:MAG: hypothetical protein DRH12_17925 [Deltaproteobacteria bacterium]|nr:MAG: hypothetical protein DRH12_17925 [Deltaproteobacteria bacterium]
MSYFLWHEKSCQGYSHKNEPYLCKCWDKLANPFSHLDGRPMFRESKNTKDIQEKCSKKFMK